MTLRLSQAVLASAALTLAAAAFPAHPALAAKHKAPAVDHRAPSVAPRVAVQGDAVAGMRLYQSCMGCHSLDENEIGPRHRGVVGRRAGSVPGYAYSSALRSSGIVWTPLNLDQWLTNPQKKVPGAKMFFSVAKPKDRADIIAYLAQQR